MGRAMAQSVIVMQPCQCNAGIDTGLGIAARPVIDLYTDCVGPSGSGDCGFHLSQIAFGVVVVVGDIDRCWRMGKYIIGCLNERVPYGTNPFSCRGPESMVENLDLRPRLRRPLQKGSSILHGQHILWMRSMVDCEDVDGSVSLRVCNDVNPVRGK